ncbi:MAG: class I SAM-dependent methyltransferase, partial [Patescibacteria group bacterium]
MDIKYTGDEALRYAKFIEKSFSWDFLEKPIIEERIKPLISDRTKILDAGCGSGRTVGLLMEMGARAENILATDVSPHMLKLAQDNYPGANFIESDLANLELPKESIDIVLSNMVLQYLDDNDLQKALNIFYHNLKSGSYLLFITVHP